MAQHRIAIALGSGAARGWAHIGVLQALAEVGIKPTIVCGCSIGALVGAVHATGKLDELADWVTTLRWTTIVSFMDVTATSGGLIAGDKLMQYFSRWYADLQIEDLPLPFAAVATDLTRGSDVWLREGSLRQAVRASFAIPELFTPVEREDAWLVDGGLRNPVPISLCRALGADKIIAVNLNGGVVGRLFNPVDVAETETVTEIEEPQALKRMARQLKFSLAVNPKEMLKQTISSRNKAPSLFSVSVEAINIMQDHITRSRMVGDPPDVLLTPQLAHLGLLDFDRADEAIAEGRACVERMLPSLQALING